MESVFVFSLLMIFCVCVGCSWISLIPHLVVLLNNMTIKQLLAYISVSTISFTIASYAITNFEGNSIPMLLTIILVNVLLIFGFKVIWNDRSK